MMILSVFLLLLLLVHTICYKVLPIRDLLPYTLLYAKDVKKINKDQTRVRLLVDIKDIGKKDKLH